MTETIAALAGAIVGAVLTFVLTQFAGARAMKQQRKLHVLAVLMGGRGRIFSQEVSDAVNLIPVVFYGDREVRSAYQHFCAVKGDAGPLFFERYIELVIAVANNLGYTKRITQADISLGFYPGPPIDPASIQPVEKKSWWPFGRK